MLLRNVFGVDLGTSTVKIYSLKKNQITKEKNMLAVKDKNQVLAVGNDAYEMFEKAPDNIEVASPMSYGMIADVEYMEIVLQTLLHRAEKHAGRRPVIYFSVPTDMSEIEKRAYLAIARGGQLRKCKVYIVERPMADALALGLSIPKTKGSMIVNIGAQSSEVSIIADGRVIISKILKVGGKQMNLAICEMVRRKKNLLIGSRTARRLKVSMASMQGEQKEARKIVGLNTLSGLPREALVSSALVCDAIREPVDTIGEEIKVFIERTPPQIAANILAEGIYLTGGSTQIPQIDTYLQDYVGCAVHLSPYFDLCTIRGIEELITHKPLHKLAHTIKERRVK